jgi:hypothetical protein
VSAGDTFNIGVVCPGHTCKFQMRVLTTSEFVLEDGVEFQTYLYPLDSRVFTFTIPQLV